MLHPLELIQEHAQQGAELRLAFFAANAPLVDAVALCLARQLAAGNKILSCGNGGSAADAQHFTAELVGRFLLERPGLPAIALTANTSNLTSIGNDYGYDAVFSRQVEALGQPGDVLLAISTSGNSPNILQALETARARKVITVGLCGKGGGGMAPLCDYLLDVGQAPTPLVQEVHEAVIHLVCRVIEYYLFENAVALHEARV